MKKRSAAVLTDLPDAAFPCSGDRQVFGLKNFYTQKRPLQVLRLQRSFFYFTSTVSGGLRALKCAIQTCKKGGKSIFVSKL